LLTLLDFNALSIAQPYSVYKNRSSPVLGLNALPWNAMWRWWSLGGYWFSCSAWRWGEQQGWHWLRVQGAMVTMGGGW